MGHEPSPLHTRRLKSQHHENSSSTSTNTALSVSCTRTLRELAPSPSRLASHSMFLGPGVLVPRGRSALHLPFSARVSLPCLALARSATPSRPCYRRLGLQLAVGENIQQATVHFSILFTSVRGCLVRHAHCYREFPRFLGLPLLSPFKSRPIARLQLQSIPSAGTLLPSPPYRLPRSRPSVTLSRRIALPRWRMSTPWVLE